MVKPNKILFLYSIAYRFYQGVKFLGWADIEEDGVAYKASTEELNLWLSHQDPMDLERLLSAARKSPGGIRF